MSAVRATAARVPGLPALTEEQFLQQVRDLATLTGWASYHTRDSRKSDRGWPDLVLASRAQGRVIFAELKTATGDVTDDQRAWLSILSSCGQEATVWRPADLTLIKAILRGQSIPFRRAEEEFC